MVSRPAVLLAGLAAALVACGEARPRLEPAPQSPPADQLVRGSTTLPSVDGIWMRGGAGDDLELILRFSQPMDTRSVEAGLRVVRAAGTVWGSGDGEALSPSVRPVWDVVGRELTARYASAGTTAVVVTLPATLIDLDGRGLDGTVDARPGIDPASYHRLADDGFAAPSSYVSLPYYPAGTLALADRPVLLLSNARPRLQCAPPGSRAVTGTTDLGLWDGREPVACRLQDLRDAPERPGIFERRDPAVWHPEHVPSARLIPGAGSPVSAAAAWGPDGSLPIRSDWVVDALIGENGLRVRNLALAADADLEGLHLWSPNRRDLLIPVTGHTVPDILWVAATLAGGLAVRDPENTRSVIDATRAWGRDAMVGHNFRWDTLVLRIIASGGSRLEFESVVPCTDCTPYSVETRLAALFVPGAPLALASPWLQFRPTTPLTGGEVVLAIDGGRDRDGLPLYDGQRDGDEETGIPDDRVTYRLMSP